MTALTHKMVAMSSLALLSVDQIVFAVGSLVVVALEMSAVACEQWYPHGATR